MIWFIFYFLCNFNLCLVVVMVCYLVVLVSCEFVVLLVFG